MSQVGQSLYIVICHDRHVNDQVTVHTTRQGADDQLAKFQAEYGEDYAWTERTYGRSQGWVRYVDTGGGDGPSARIEETTLLP